MKTIKEIRETYPTISLKRICEETHLCYQYILKASKQPIPNQTYDASAFNYAAVNSIIEKKNVDFDSINWEEIAQSIKVTTPLSKQEEFKLDVTFKIRTEDTLYKVIYTTPTHIVFIAAAPTSTQPRVMNWDTFLHQSPRIVSPEPNEA